MMAAMLSVVLCILCTVDLGVAKSVDQKVTPKSPYDQYVESWDLLDHKERNDVLGADIQLTKVEENVDKYLKHLKAAEYNKTGEDQKILGSTHFFKYKEYLERTEFFKFFKGLPKGGLLHVHDVALVNLDFVVKNITYMPHLWICEVQDSSITLLFSDNSNSLPQCSTNWVLVSQRRAEKGEAEFNKMLKDYMSMVTAKPGEKYPDEDTAWRFFERGLFAVVGMFRYEEAFKVYNRKLLEDVIADKVDYIEMRGFLPTLTNLKGKEMPERRTIELYKEISDDMKNKHPGFMGMSYIVTGFKSESKEKVKKRLETTLELQKTFGKHFIPGFDLVGQETKGYPIVYYAEELLEFQDKHEMTYFMHAGETGQYGTDVDKNLIDTTLLNNPRIGHGYAIIRHPEVMNKIKEMGRVLEICPISNMVLKLVKDLKNHPAAQLISKNHTVVISSDDFAAWETTPLTHDMTLTYLTLLGKDGGLETIKSLIKNSIIHSSLSDEDKATFLENWGEKWAGYLETFAKSRSVKKVLKELKKEENN